MHLPLGTIVPRAVVVAIEPLNRSQAPNTKSHMHARTPTNPNPNLGSILYMFGIIDTERKSL